MTHNNSSKPQKQSIHPPNKFTYIENCVFRCQEPIQSQHLTFLKSLSLTNIVNFSPSTSSNADLDIFTEENMIYLHNIDSSSNNSSNYDEIFKDFTNLSKWIQESLELLIPLAANPSLLIIGRS